MDGATPRRIAYGPAPEQFGDLTLPQGDGPHPIVVFIHGGFWRNRWDLSLAEPIAADAASRGSATWNIEYRRVGDPGGGYPGTLNDVATAVDQLAVVVGDADLDLRRVAVVGHSAGGHLALWVGQRSKLPSDAPGGQPKIVPRIVVGQAPVSDLAWASAAGLGAGAVDEMMVESVTADAQRWELADPSRLLPPVCKQLIVHGTADTDVPIEASLDYLRKADSNGDGKVELIEFDGADHFDMIDPVHDSWTVVKRRLSQLRSG